MAGSLDGVRVVDFGHYVAGPLAAVMLADQGADVIHIDPPGKPRWRTPADAFFNRSKRRITLDLKQVSDRTVAQRLVATSDVLIENFRPGVMDRLGLGAAEMTGRDSRLIYCSIPGFAGNDPRAGVPAWEGVIDAATENCRPRVGEEPPGWDWERVVYSALPMASNFSAFLAATSIVMALIARHRSGKGQRIEAPLFHAMFHLIGPAGAYVSARGLREPRPIDVNGSGTYRCGDGRYVQFDPSSYRFLPWFAEAAGISNWGAELLDEIELRNPDNNRQLHERLTELFLTRSAAEWETLGNEAGAALAFIRKPSEWIATEHARTSGAVIQLSDPELGPTWMPGLPVHATGSPGSVRGPRHLPDADRASILAELEGWQGGPAATAPEPNLASALQGLRVVDLCQVLAGPTGGRLLAEFGADVVKIYGPHSRIGGHGYLNRGKRSLLLDVKSRDGQQVFWKLMEHADALLQNFPCGTAERYGIGYNQVKARNPGIIYTSVSCYGYGGPWAAGRGYERQGQAVTGVEERTGDVPSILGPYNLIDLGTGCLEAFAVALGIFHRYRTGEGQHVQASLAQTATYHQGPFFLDYKGKVWDEPRGWDALGTGPLQRFYRAQDGWLFLGAKPEEINRVGEAIQLAGIESLQGKALEDALEAVFSQQPASGWAELLQEAGVGAHAVVRRAELMKDPWARANGLSVTQLVEGVGEVTMPGVPIRLSGTPMRVGQAAGPAGSDAESVLKELGLAGKIPELERAWALQVHDLPPAW